jgi:hypothetical protein
MIACVVAHALPLSLGGACFAQECEVRKVGELVSGVEFDRFGWNVRMSGDTAIVNAFSDDELGDNAGAAYILRRHDDEWAVAAKLTAPDGAAGDWFGASVDISGDTAVVGATRDDDLGDSAGAVYVFRDDGVGHWVQVAKLTASDGRAGDEFGGADISGDTLIVQGDRPGVYVFQEDAFGNWSEVAKLPGRGPADFSGETVIFGAPTDNTNGRDSGAAFIFRRDDVGNWTEIAKLLPSDGREMDRFGRSVAIDRDTVAIAAMDDEADGEDRGAVYVFREDGAGSWNEIGKLAASDGFEGNAFAWTVDISDATIAVGAPAAEGDGGAVYFYRESPSGQWLELGKFALGLGYPRYEFGRGVAISGSTALASDFEFDGDEGWRTGYVHALDIGCECTADFNQDGAVDSRDVIAFLNAWVAGDSSADADGNGVIDSRDVTAFLNLWTAGC